VPRRQLRCRGCAVALTRPRPLRCQDKEEAESRLARLQVEHLDLTQRFMEYKAAESARVRLFPFALTALLCIALRTPASCRARCVHAAVA
jgi:hypothetical protein